MENWAKWADGARGGGGMLRDSTFLSSHLTNKRSLWVCATTHTKHTPTRCSKTRAHAQICTTPTVYTNGITSTAHTGSPFFQHYAPHPLLPYSPQHRPPQKNISSPPPSASRTHTQGQNPQGSTGPDWECLVMNHPVLSAESAASRQTSFWRAICRYEYAWESVIQATSTTCMMPKVTSVRSEILALCWAFGDM